MQRAMARQAEAEREKRAKIIHAAGELEASDEVVPGRCRNRLRACRDYTAISSDADRNCCREKFDDRLPPADRDDASVETDHRSGEETVNDEGFREIQLNGKQLIFLFMAVTVVLVVTFLFGVLVGRGVREGGAAPEIASSDIASDPGLVPASEQAGPPAAAGGAAAPAPPAEELSYADRLLRDSAPPETLKPAAQTAPAPVVQEPVSQKAPVPPPPAGSARKQPAPVPAPCCRAQATVPRYCRFRVSKCASDARLQCPRLRQRRPIPPARALQCKWPRTGIARMLTLWRSNWRPKAIRRSSWIQ